MENMKTDTRHKNNRKILIIFAFLSLLVNAAAAASHRHKHRSRGEYAPASAAVRSTCAATRYPDLCLSSTLALKDIFKNKEGILKKFFGRSFSSTITSPKIKDVFQKLHQSLTRRGRGALGDCFVMSVDTVDQIASSQEIIKNVVETKNYSMLVAKKQVLYNLLSAAQTNVVTCLGGFSRSSDDKKVHEALKSELMIPLRLANNMMSSIDRVLSGGEKTVKAPPVKRRVREWPEWLSVDDRTLLEKGEVAADITKNLSAFYDCGMIGNQNTLYVHSLRQFYKKCFIVGTVDIIFGNAAVVLQNCRIHARSPTPKQNNTITAQGRDHPSQSTGIVILNSHITATLNAKGKSATYLGRPWGKYSRTVVIGTKISIGIHPAGWSEWDGKFALDTLFYAEYKNTGPGAGKASRVKWNGIRVLNSTKAQEIVSEMESS